MVVMSGHDGVMTTGDDYQSSAGADGSVTSTLIPFSFLPR